jgi:opine dehydrogenase
MGVNSVAILGAGHGGCAAAADLSKRGYSVRLHARNPERLAPLRAQGGIEARGIQQGLVPIDLLTTDVAEAVRGAHLIMVVVPSVAHAHYARALASLLDGSQPIFINPGHTGGGLHFLHELRNAGYRGLFGAARRVRRHDVLASHRAENGDDLLPHLPPTHRGADS